MMTMRMLTTVALGLRVIVPGQVRAQYLFTPIDVPGAAATYANGNSSHEIAGEFDDEDGNTHGFVLSKGVFTQFDVPGADSYTSVNGINANGERSGIYHDGVRFHGYFWSKGVFTTLDPAGSILSTGNFLNARGQVVGFYRSADNTRHAYLWSKGGFTTFYALGAAATLGTNAFGINDHGEIVGAYVSGDGNRHGYLRSSGAFTTIDAPEADGYTVAEGIDNVGQIVGYSTDADGTSHGYILSDGVYTTIDVPGSFWTEVYSNNAKGEIVGAYEDAAGIHGFLGTPHRWPLPPGATSLRTAVVMNRSPTLGGDTVIVGGIGGFFALRSAGWGSSTPGWIKLGDGLPSVVVTDLQYDAKDDLVIAGTCGRGSWTLQHPAAPSGPTLPDNWPASP
jgi:probable HAF family extracellular repeat protein